MMALRKKKGDDDEERPYGSSGGGKAGGGRGYNQGRKPSPYEQGPSAGGYGSATTKLGELLLAAQAVSPDQLAEALAKQPESGGKRLGELLVDLRIVNESQLAAALAEQA